MKRIAHSLVLADSTPIRMKIDQPLTPDLAEKWKRLLVSQGGDPEALALAAVELLWKKYGREVERQERALARMNRQVAKTKKRLSKICPKSRVPTAPIGKQGR